MSRDSLFSFLELIAGVIYEILGSWLGDLLWKYLGVDDIPFLRILPAIVIGLFMTAYWGKRNEKKVKENPSDSNVLKLSMQNTIAQGGILSLIPLFFFWCGDKTLLTQSANVFASFAPLALGVYQAEQIHKTVDRLFAIGHDFLERMSKSKYQVKIREKWLYEYLRAHDATRGIDDIALRRFVVYKMHLWQHERNDVKLSHGNNGWIAEVQVTKDSTVLR